MPQTVVVTEEQVRVVTVGVQGPPGSPGPAGPQGPPGTTTDLSSYARKDQANTFTGDQTVNGVLTATALVGDGSGLTDLQLPDNLAYTDQANVFTETQTVSDGANSSSVSPAGVTLSNTFGSNRSTTTANGYEWTGEVSTAAIGSDGLYLGGSPEAATATLQDGAKTATLTPHQLSLAFDVGGASATLTPASLTVVGQGEGEPTSELAGGFLDITNGSDAAFLSASGGSWSGAGITIELQKIPGGQTTTVAPDGITTGYGQFSGDVMMDAEGRAGQFGQLSGNDFVAATCYLGDAQNRIYASGGNPTVHTNYHGTRFEAVSPAAVPFTVRGATGQTADLIQCQTSTGAVLAKVTPLGTVVCPNPEGSGVEVRLGAAYGQPGTYSGGTNHVIGESGVRLQVGNTGNSFTVSAGGLTYLASGTSAPFQVYSRDAASTNPAVQVTAPDASATYFSVGHDGRTQITASAAGNVPLTIQGLSGQTADLQRWGTRTAVAANGDPILSSPDGTRYRLQVADDGTLSTTPA